MDILVCIKQVPASNKVEVDSVTGVLLRNGADSKMNPYDLYALETALKIREEVGGTISVIRNGTTTGNDSDQRSICHGS